MAQPPPSKTAPKSTAPKGVPVSSQHYLDVAQIRDGVVVMKDGSMRAIVLVNAVNFALKSEDEQNALVYSYQGFLNSFSFPIQIVMQSRQLDLANYIQKLQDRLAETTNELVQLQITDYMQFIGRLIQIANIMDKKFYVIVPFTPPISYQRGMFDKLFNPANRLEVKMSPGEFKAYRQELLERTKIIMEGLSGVGVRTALLATQEVIELLYASYNPEEATKERLTKVEDVTGSYVHPTANNTPRPAAQGTSDATPADQRQSSMIGAPPAAVEPEPVTTPTPAPVAEAQPQQTTSPEPVTTPSPAPVEQPTVAPTTPVAAPAPVAPGEAIKPVVPPTNDLTLPETLPLTSGPTNTEPTVKPVAAPTAPTAPANPLAPTTAPAPHVAQNTPGFGAAIPGTKVEQPKPAPEV